MITCPACQKQNQDHYRFCLGCGAELPRGVAKQPSEPPPEIEDEQTQVGGVVTDEIAVLSAPSPPVAADGEAVADGGEAEAAAASTAGAPSEPPDTVVDAGAGAAADAHIVSCPECSHPNPPNNRFCATCGFRLNADPAGGQAAVGEGAVTGAVLVALDPEGNEVGRYDVPAGESVVGRDAGSVFAGDAYLSPRHARIAADGKTVRIRDAGSLNGVFRKLLADQSEPLEPGQRFRIGQELMQYDELEGEDVDEHDVEVIGAPDDGYHGRLSLVVGRETLRPSFPVHERGVHLGRERGDVLFAEDGYVSGLHCFVGVEDGQAYVTDLGSSNGTFVQLLGEVELRNGDVLLMGQQLFRVVL